MLAVSIKKILLHVWVSGPYGCRSTDTLLSIRRAAKMRIADCLLRHTVDPPNLPESGDSTCVLVLPAFGIIGDEQHHDPYLRDIINRLSDTTAPPSLCLFVLQDCVLYRYNMHPDGPELLLVICIQCVRLFSCNCGTFLPLVIQESQGLMTMYNVTYDTVFTAPLAVTSFHANLVSTAKHQPFFEQGAFNP